MNRPLAIIACVLSVTVNAQSPDTLDLTQLRTSRSGATTAGTSSGSAAGLGSHSVHEHMTLQIRLEWLDRMSYRYGDPLTFRLRLRNVGGEPVAIPWEPDASQVLLGPDAPLEQALLSLDVDLPGGRAPIPVAVLYGSKLSRGHMRVLQPGETADVLAAASWEFQPYTAESIHRGFSGSVNVTAKLDFLTPINGRVYANMRSVNHVRIALEKPRSD